MKRVELIREDPKEGLSDGIVRVKNVTYGICLRNHSIYPTIYGVHVDGCQEFTTKRNGEEGTDAARYCVACGCHRDHHYRIETEIEVKAENSSSSTNRA